MSDNSKTNSNEDTEGDNLIAISSEMYHHMEQKEAPKLLTVKFCVGEDVLTRSFVKNTTILTLKQTLTEVCSNSTINNMMLYHKDVELSNEVTLEDLKCDCYGVIEFIVRSLDPEVSISIDDAHKEIIVPDIITVKVQTEDKGIVDVVVEIEDRRIVKPYLGGYVDTNTGLEYHHGYSQTGPPPSKLPAHMRNHRDCQTCLFRNRHQQMTYSTATQMSNNAVWIPSVTDRILTAKPYETAEEREKRLDVDGKVRIIQRYFRALNLIRHVKQSSGEYKKRIQKELEADELELRLDEDRKKKDLICKVLPYTSRDFSMLYAMLNRWKKNEINRINSSFCGPAKIAEFYMLLDKEIEMLQTIEKLIQKTKADRLLQEDIDFFNLICSPLEWNSDYKNIHVEMDTLETQKAREYRTLYEKFCNHSKDKEERIKAMLDIKELFVNHHCEITIELNNLINRACDLLTRDVGLRVIDNLQKRMEGLLLQHVKQTACNEGITNRQMRVKEKLMEDNLYFCQRCQKLKTIESFALNARENKIRICSRCNAMDMSTEVWVDLSPFSFILRQIRRQEMINRAASSVAFILQDKDIYHLITVIWHSHSALSECSDIYKLRLCRWNKDVNWSPWNCILLTNEEMKAHLKVEELTEVYEEEFINHIFNKHALARKHFTHLADIDELMTEKSNKDRRLDGTTNYRKFIPVNSKTRLYYQCH